MRPLSWLYRAVVAIRKKLYQWGLLKQHAFSVPVIVVGNVTVGGTGKSPTVAWCVDQCRQLGLKPGIVSRGYGGCLSKRGAVVQATHRAEEVGDEPLMLFCQTHAPVVIGANRVTAVQRLIDMGCDVVISDDGLQHYAMRRDLELIMLDGQRGLGNGLCLPAGPLRETMPTPSGTCWLVTTTTCNHQAGTDDLSITIQPVDCYRLNQPDQRLELSVLSGKTLHAVSGIGNPKRFMHTLQALKVNVIAHVYPDHHVFRESDLRFADEHAVIITEKDAVKCRVFANDNVWVLTIKAQPSEALAVRLLQCLS